jgi:hypothetical protein
MASKGYGTTSGASPEARKPADETWYDDRICLFCLTGLCRSEVVLEDEKHLLRQVAGQDGVVFGQADGRRACGGTETC